MKTLLKTETWDFIAKYAGDLSKAIVTVGFASYFFEKLPIIMRFGFIAIAVACFFLSVIILERKGGK